MLTLTSLLLVIGLAVAQSPEHATTEKQTMNNDAIAKMMKAGLSDDIILKTIAASSGSYDTSPDGLNALKVSGASDRLIAAVQNKATQVVTNNSIENMLKAGLSDDIILKIVDANPGSYDVSTDALNALKAAGVDDRLISAILRKSGRVVISGIAGSTRKPADPKIPEIKEPEQMGKVFYLNPAKKALEPLSGETWKRKNRSTGFGSSKAVDVVAGPHASYRLSSKDKLIFVFRPLPGQYPSQIRILPFEVKGDQRESVISAFKSGFGGTTNLGNQNTVPLELVRYGTFSYALNPPDFHLDPGEYWFSLPGEALNDPLITFGVD